MKSNPTIDLIVKLQIAVQDNHDNINYLYALMGDAAETLEDLYNRLEDKIELIEEIHRKTE